MRHGGRRRGRSGGGGDEGARQVVVGYFDKVVPDELLRSATEFNRTCVGSNISTTSPDRD